MNDFTEHMEVKELIADLREQRIKDAKSVADMARKLAAADEIIEDQKHSLCIASESIDKMHQDLYEARRHAEFYAKQVGDIKVMLNEQITCRNEAQAQLEVMRRALEFYANEENYEDELISMDSEGWSQYRKNSVVQDNGDMASKALSTTPAEAMSKVQGLVDALENFIDDVTMETTMLEDLNIEGNAVSMSVQHLKVAIDGASNVLEAWKEGKPC